MLFTEAKSKKELQREAEAKAAAALAKVAGEKKKEPDKRDIFVDTRDQKKEADGMEDWDDEKLKEVVSKKSGGQGLRCQTDIICKHFIDAVETRRYGWFWECPNGGDKCQYRHALPEGYVLKRDQASGPKGPDEGPRLEDIIEEKRKALTARTPVTLERLIEWLEKKKAAAAAAENADLEEKRAAYAKTGKAAGVTGKMLFTIDASLFVDDAAANDVQRDVYADEDDEEVEEGEEGAGDKADGGQVTAGSRAQTFVPLRPGDIRPPTPPPEETPPPPPPPPPPPAGADDDDEDDDEEEGDDVDDAAAASEPAELEYGANYDEGGAGAPSAGAAGAADLTGVDESLFLDEDLPDDDELE